MLGPLFNEAFRKRTARRLIKRTGCSPEAARLAAIAMHPFSSRPASPELEKFVRRSSRAFALQLRGARNEDEILAAARPIVQSFVSAAEATRGAVSVENLDIYVRTSVSIGTTTYDWRKALDDTAPMYPGAAEFAARADALAEAIPPEQRGTDLHPDVDPELKKQTADSLVAAIARGEYRYTYSGELIEGGREPDLATMRRPVPLKWPIRYRCAQGHPLIQVSERPHNSHISHGWCDECPERWVWAYVEWDEPVPEHLPRTRLLPLSARPG